MIFKLRIQKIDPVILQEDDQPSGHWFARVHIAVASHSKDENDDTILLSAECRTAGEVEYWADRMIKELEGIKREAKKMDWSDRSR